MERPLAVSGREKRGCSSWLGLWSHFPGHLLKYLFILSERQKHKERQTAYPCPAPAHSPTCTHSQGLPCSRREPRCVPARAGVWSRTGTESSSRYPRHVSARDKHSPGLWPLPPQNLHPTEDRADPGEELNQASVLLHRTSARPFPWPHGSTVATQPRASLWEQVVLSPTPVPMT